MAPSTATALLAGTLALLGLASTAAAAPPRQHEREPRQAACAPVPSPSKYPTWSQLPQQSTMPDPFLPLAYTTTDNAGAGGSSAADFARDVMSGRGKGRIQTPEEWYRCRQPEIIQMLQEYHSNTPPFPS
ncbi:putative carbohydrate esterase family 15 protein [Rosellinia necatrix]|uniref:Putative carbohydrate esterase family 15 protein n=1 Tax=Rosellinia necatrix TaxID=77044 RepID=A0A1S8A729_ROSNE|nr:putative carbohydrate esterase family 15 protein [Rosellinia necatrix]